MTINVIDYSTASDPLAAMKAATVERRARLYAVRPEPVAPVEIVPPPVKLPVKPKRDYIRDWLALASPASIKPAPHRRIIDIVAEQTGINRIDLLSDRRTANVVMPRQICFYLLKSCTALSLPLIGRYMGGKDHTTVLHGVRKIASLIETDAALRAQVESLTLRIQSETASLQAEESA